MPPVKLSELELAFNFVGSSALFSDSAYISRRTGEIFWESDSLDFEEELPEDLGDPDRYIAIPHKNDLDLGKRLVLRFVASNLPDACDDVADMFRRKGAYSRYKDLLEREGQLDSWHCYEDAATKAALREWSAGAGIDIVDDYRHGE